MSVRAVRAGALADSAAAMALRDSLDRAGWEAYVRRAAPDDAPSLPPWRVHLAPAERASEVPILVAAALRAGGARGAVVVDDTLTLPTWASVQRVSTGARGMLARARWVMDGSAERLLAVEDEAGVENEPFPDGFLFVDERDGHRFLMQQDSVWDVAPSPDWREVAYGRAYRFANPDSLYVRDAGVISYFTGLSIPDIQRHRFLVSAMEARYGFAHPRIVPLADTGVVTSPMTAEARSRVPVAGGWRVRWSTDGRVLAVGRRPSRVTDDAPAREWKAVDAASRLVRDVDVAHLALATVPWVQGPLLDVSVPLDSAPRTLTVEGGLLESARGWIRVRGGASGWRDARILGPGTALAATRSGRYVLAIAPRADMDEQKRARGERPTQLVVYELRP
jgi:hypothetical protein